MDPIFELRLTRPPKGSRSSSDLLFSQLRDAIVQGRLAAGARLPPTRASEAAFGVSRHTCASVYERLSSMGYATSQHGSGTYVAFRRDPAFPLAREATGPDPRLNPVWLSDDAARAMGFWREHPAGQTGMGRELADFRPAVVDPRHFPHEVFRRVSGNQLRRIERRAPGLRSAQGNQGHHALRRAVTDHIALTRAVACRAEEILIVSGAQQGFDLLARALVRAGETVVAVEDPGYPPLRVPFMAAGAVLVPVPVDDEGLVVAALPPGAKVICVTPSHQFPLGVSMSAARRQALLEHARNTGAVIIEDDYDGEFRHEGGPLEALKTGDRSQSVFYVGTFSKCMLPSLRLGFVIAPEWALPTLVAAKNAQDWHCSTPLQATVAAFIAEGHLARHVRKMRDLYAERRDLLRRRLERDLAPWLQPVPSLYGMHTTAIARPGVDLETMASELLGRGVIIHTLHRYFLGEATHAGLVFGFGAVMPPQLGSGLDAVCRAFDRG